MRVVLQQSIQELRRLWRRERDAQCGRRLHAVLLAAEGRAAGDIAPLVGMSMRRVQGWVRRYNEEGVAGLARRGGCGRKPLLNPEEIERLKARLEAPPRPEDGVCALRAKDVQRILETEFGKVRQLGAVYYLLHQLGYESLVPRPRHRRSDPAAQEAFKKNFAVQVAEIQAQHPDRRIVVYFEDEARFGQQGTLTRVWARRGSRPTAVRQTQYEYAWVLSAVAPSVGEAEGLVSPRLNAKVINLFLKQFSERLPPDVHAVLVWDGAGYHCAGALETPANVTLLRLPPYAPELNPVENLWHYLKSHYWSNRLYDDYEALGDAVQTAWQAVCLVPAMIKSICHATYAGDSNT